MARIRRSWNLVKASWSVLRADKELALFPVISGVVTVVALLALAGLYFGIADGGADAIAETFDESSGSGVGVLELVIIFAIYFVTSVVATFFNAALIGAAMMRLRGGDPTFRDGLRMASSRVGAILGYGAIAATVGVLISLLRERGGLLGSLGSGVLSIGWGVATFLVVPVLVAENIGPVEAIRRSGSLLKKTWGEQIAGNAAIGIIAMLISVPIAVAGGLLIFAAAGTDSNALVALAVILMLIAIVLIGVIFSALGAIYRAAVYEFAAEEIVAPQYGSGLLEQAFVSKA